MDDANATGYNEPGQYITKVMFLQEVQEVNPKILIFFFKSTLQHTLFYVNDAPWR
jgi:hypothetical protein